MSKSYKQTGIDPELRRVVRKTRRQNKSLLRNILRTPLQNLDSIDFTDTKYTVTSAG